MKRLSWGALGAGLLCLSACATTDTGYEDKAFYEQKLESPYQEQSRIKAMLPEAIAPTQTRYNCDNGDIVKVRFYGGAVASTIIPQVSSTRAYLEGRPTGSGFLYAAGPLEIRGQGDEMMLADDKGLNLICQAAE